MGLKKPNVSIVVVNNLYISFNISDYPGWRTLFISKLMGYPQQWKCGGRGLPVVK
ncbi:MAG TPA: hypothetical protein VKN36_14335 [Eudoraea sp.]|nr:hypothetical protein [Eudoraea sp.]